MESALLGQSRQFFTRGFKKEQLSGKLYEQVDNPNLFKASYRNPDEIQVNCRTEDDLKNLTPYLAAPDSDEVVSAYRTLYETSVMLEPEVKADIIDHVPALSRLFDVWNESSLHGMSLTSVGLAIGHAYWRRTNKDLPDLCGWL